MVLSESQIKWLKYRNIQVRNNGLNFKKLKVLLYDLFVSNPHEILWLISTTMWHPLSFIVYK